MERGWEPGGGTTSRRRAPAALLAVAAVLAGALLARPDGVAPDPGGGDLEVVEVPAPTAPAPGPPVEGRSPPAATAPPAPEAEVLPGRWRTVPAPEELLGEDLAVAWDGERHLLVFGGQRWFDDGRRSELSDRAWLYDDRAERWRALPPPPLSPRSAAAAAWTGSAFLVWGGIGATQVHADGALYDPGADRWEPLPEAPLSPRHRATAVALADGSVLVAGGADHAGMLLDAARLDPAGAWHTAPSLPDEAASWGVWTMTGLAVGDTALLWTAEQWGAGGAPPLLLGAAGWEPTDVDLGRDPAFGVVRLADGRVVGAAGQPAGGTEALLELGPGSLRWEALAAVPQRASGTLAVGAVAGRLPALLDAEGGGLAYDEAAGRWLALPPAGQRVWDPQASRAHATPDGLLVLERRADGGRIEAWQVARFTLAGPG